MKLTEFFLPILKPYKWHYFMMFQIPLISVAFYIFNSVALKLVIDGSNNNLMIPITILVGIAILQEIICRGGQFAFIKSQPFIRGEIVSRAYNYVQSHSYQFFQNNQTGSLVSKIKAIVAGYDDLFEYIWYRVTNPLFMVIFGIASLFFINYYLAFLVLFWSLIFLVIMIKMAFKLGKLSQKSNDAKHQVIAMVADNISNIFTIFSFASKQKELAKIKKFACGEVANLDYKKNFYHFKFASIGAILFCSMLSSILFLAAYLKARNIITTGDFVYIVTIIYKIIYDIWLLSENIGRFFDKIGDFKSSFAVLQIKQELIDKPSAGNLII